MFGTRCIRLNVRSVLLIIFCFVVNGIKYSNTAINHMETPTKSGVLKNSTNIDFFTFANSNADTSKCPTNLECKNLPISCLKCDFDESCTYGKEIQVNCNVNSNIMCTGPKEFQRSAICRYCWQTENWEHFCQLKDNCNSAKEYYVTNCTVQPELLCLGNRTFQKRLKCNWTHGYKWSTALFISITLGGFGTDRFYLGHWQEGIGKLFSFGGLGVWTLIDVILISLHYLGPADGSLYI